MSRITLTNGNSDEVRKLINDFFANNIVFHLQTGKPTNPTDPSDPTGTKFYPDLREFSAENVKYKNFERNPNTPYSITINFANKAGFAPIWYRGKDNNEQEFNSWIEVNGDVLTVFTFDDGVYLFYKFLKGDQSAGSLLGDVKISFENVGLSDFFRN